MSAGAPAGALVGGHMADVCDTNHARVAKIRKERPPERETHRGVHARLRQAVATLRGCARPSPTSAFPPPSKGTPYGTRKTVPEQATAVAGRRPRRPPDRAAARRA